MSFSVLRSKLLSLDNLEVDCAQPHTVLEKIFFKEPFLLCVLHRLE